MGIFSKLKGKSVKDDVQKSTQDSSADKKEEKKPAVQKNEKADKSSIKAPKSSGNAYKVLKRAIVSEKAAMVGEQNKYIFEVAFNSNKQMVKDAIYKLYGVRPEKVNIITMKGKAVRYGRIKGTRKDWKKAIVEMPKGTKIELYEGV